MTATPLRPRKRLARSEVWMMLATLAQTWADRVVDTPGCGTIPFAQWGADDPFQQLAVRYDLTPLQLSQAIAAVAASAETAAFNSGYEEHWDDEHLADEREAAGQS